MPSNSYLPAIVQLAMSTPDPDVVTNPGVPLAAIAEILFTSIALSAFLTWMVKPEALEDNPIRRMVGYNNACVTWDSPPALYIAAFMFTFNNCLAARYHLLDTKRAYMSPKLGPNMRIGVRVINGLFVLSMSVNMGIFIVTPMDGSLLSMHIHSFCFVQLIPMLAIMMAMNYYVEWVNGTEITTIQSFAVCLFCLWSLAMTIMASIAVFAYKNDGVIIIPTKLMQFVDWGWFATMPICAFFMPAGKDMRMQFSLVDAVP